MKKLLCPEVYNLPKTGVIGILIRAKLDGKISSLKKEIDQLHDEAGFWISKELYKRVLHQVGEFFNANARMP